MTMPPCAMPRFHISSHRPPEEERNNERERQQATHLRTRVAVPLRTAVHGALMHITHKYTYYITYMPRIQPSRKQKKHIVWVCVDG